MSRNISEMVFEVGPRDGLQNQSQTLSIDKRAELISRLSQCGLQRIETGAFVHPKWVPQLKDSALLLEQLKTQGLDDIGPVLVPNLTGLKAAIDSGVKSIAVFIAASETFSHKNTNRSIQESLEQSHQVIQSAREHGIRHIRGYVSTCLHCPYEGNIPASQAKSVCRQLYNLGINELVVSDTTGAGHPSQVRILLQQLTQEVPVEQIHLHLHDTYDMALANVWEGINCGVQHFDSSIGGLGGCPYAPGAGGNLATEKLAYFLALSGYQQDLDLSLLSQTARWITQEVGLEWKGEKFCTL